MVFHVSLEAANKARADVDEVDRRLKDLDKDIRWEIGQHLWFIELDDCFAPIQFTT